MKLKNRFYPGVRDILTSGYAVESIDLAVERARKILVDEPARDYVAIVQIVRVVRRAVAPVRVEKVTG